jgi:hypothetical protein
VDNGLACCSSNSKLVELISYMEEHFAITQSSTDLYVGLHIHRDKAQERIFINQSAYLRRILTRFGFNNCSPVSTPADPNVKLDATTQPFEPPYFYPATIGCLLFAQTLSRPDISYVVNSVAQFSTDPQRSHFQAVNCIFWYLARTLDLALCLDGRGSLSLLDAYADADYAGDITNRKSRTGAILLINNVPVAWCSRKQTCVATSTTKSEYIAANSTTKDIIWLRRLLANLRFPQQHPTRLYSDNQSAIRLVHNPEFY